MLRVRNLSWTTTVENGARRVRRYRHVLVSISCALVAWLASTAPGQGSPSDAACLQSGLYSRTEGFGFREMLLSKVGNTLTGAYAPTMSHRIGLITFRWDEENSRYTGTWREPAPGRGGRLFDIEIRDSACTEFEADWESTSAGEWPPGNDLAHAGGHVVWRKVAELPGTE